MKSTKKQLLIYVDGSGQKPFEKWLFGIKDLTTRARIQNRLDRVENGNLGDHKSLSDGIWEMKKAKKRAATDYRTSLIERLKGDEKAQFAYLKVSLEENGDMPEVFLKAVKSVAKARGFSNFAKKTGLNRENLYRIFSNKRNPRLESLTKILDALGFQLTIVPKKAS